MSQILTTLVSFFSLHPSNQQSPPDPPSPDWDDPPFDEETAKQVDKTDATIASLYAQYEGCKSLWASAKTLASPLRKMREERDNLKNFGWGPLLTSLLTFDAKSLVGRIVAFVKKFWKNFREDIEAIEKITNELDQAEKKANPAGEAFSQAVKTYEAQRSLYQEAPALRMIHQLFPRGQEEYDHLPVLENKYPTASTSPDQVAAPIMRGTYCDGRAYLIIKMCPVERPHDIKCLVFMQEEKKKNWMLMVNESGRSPFPLKEVYNVPLLIHHGAVPPESRRTYKDLQELILNRENNDFYGLSFPLMKIHEEEFCRIPSATCTASAAQP